MNIDIMRAAGFGKEMDAVETGICPTCKKDIDRKGFKDARSLREYFISGLCQACQDEVWG